MRPTRGRDQLGEAVERAVLPDVVEGDDHVLDAGGAQRFDPQDMVLDGAGHDAPAPGRRGGRGPDAVGHDADRREVGDLDRRRVAAGVRAVPRAARPARR